MKYRNYALILGGILAAGIALLPSGAEELEVPHHFSAGEPASAAEVNANFDALSARINKLRPQYSVPATGIAEQDQANVQAALDAINGTPGQEFGGELLLEGHYRFNRNLVVKGPNVTIKGAGEKKTWLEWSEDVDGFRFDRIPGGSTAMSAGPWCPRFEDLTLACSVPSTRAGISTLSPADGEGWWNLVHLKIRGVTITGFRTGILATNVPLLEVADCNLWVKDTGIDMRKVDTFRVVGTSIIGGVVTRGGVETRTVGGTAIQARRADVMAGDENLAVAGSGFAGTITDCEIGTLQGVLDQNGYVIEFANTNVESIQGDWVFNLTFSAILKISGCRFDSGGKAGHTNRCLVRQVPANEGFPKVFFSANRYSFAYPHLIVDGGTGYHSNYWTDMSIRVEWHSTPGVIAHHFEGRGEAKNWTWWNTIAPDTSAGNARWKHQTRILPKRPGVAEASDLRFSYTDEADVWRRSSLVNAKLSRVLSRQGVTLFSLAGEDSTLWATALDAYTLGEGNELELDASGQFAANANDKRLRITVWGNELFDSGVVGHNDKKWRLTGKISSRMAGQLHSSFTLSVDGEAESVFTHIVNADHSASTSYSLLVTGQEEGDVQQTYSKLRFNQ